MNSLNLLYQLHIVRVSLYPSANPFLSVNDSDSSPTFKHEIELFHEYPLLMASGLYLQRVPPPFPS